MRHSGHKQKQLSRRGFVLPAVMAVAVLWALAAMHFSESMILHATVSTRVVNEVCVRQGILSSLSWLQALSELPEWRDQTGQQQKKWFRGISVGSEHHPMLVSITRDVSARSSIVNEMRFGLDDESAKLDINWLSSQKTNQRERLMKIRGMTPALADSMLDWIDSDHEPREFGAERNYYLSRDSLVLPPNRPVRRLSDLLSVRGVTSELLFGEDRGQIDDSDSSGVLQAPQAGSKGFSEFLTVSAAESEYRQCDLVPINSDDLQFLFDELTKRLGEEPARFIIAARLAGFVERATGRERERTPRSLRDRLEEQLHSSSEVVSRKTGAMQSADGIDLSRAPQYQIYSGWELLGTHVRILMNNQDVVLRSPWEGSASKAQEYLALFREHLDFSSFGEPLRGRLNVNAASKELLLGLPGMNELRVKKLISIRDRLHRQGHDTREDPLSWLLTERVLNLDELRKLSPWITGNGDVRTGMLHVFSPDYGPIYRFEIRLDKTQTPSSVAVTQILTPLPASHRSLLIQ